MNCGHIHLLYAPGNHDIDYSLGIIPVSYHEFEKKYGEIVTHEGNEEIKKTLETDYMKSMESFFNFAKGGRCSWGNKMIIDKRVGVPSFNIDFTLINTAPMSLMKGESLDKGKHFLSLEQKKKIEGTKEADLRIMVLHHGFEWFDDESKKYLRKMASQRYHVILSGHEHDEVAEERSINNEEPCFYIQANAFNDHSVEENGFNVIDIEFTEDHLIAYSFTKKEDIYVSKIVSEGTVSKLNPGGFQISDAHLTYLNYETDGRCIDDYYVFPGMEYMEFDEKGNASEVHTISKEKELIDFLVGKSVVSITGGRKCGKTVLAKRICREFIKNDVVTVLFDIRSKNIRLDRVIEYSFKEQYKVDEHDYSSFLQIDKEKKVAVVDDADLFKKKGFEEFLKILQDQFSTIVLIHKEMDSTDIHKQVIDAIDDRTHLYINPFYYSKRRSLIRRVLERNTPFVESIDEKTSQINNWINKQVKYFELNPEFIINFTRYYDQDSVNLFNSGKNAFTIVYENAIKERIINNSSGISPVNVINILQEIAYQMHYGKKAKIKVHEVSQIIQKYRDTYRQSVTDMTVLKVIIASGIMSEDERGLSFCDKTHEAYFVARAINKKATLDNSDPEYIEAEQNFKYTLEHLCFGINSDIVIFLSVITDNTKFLNIIMEMAEEHFDGQEELDFDKNNLPFLSNIEMHLKKDIPTSSDKERMEEHISDAEREMKANDVLELIDEYDYSEEELKELGNRLQISLKYIELISKILPAFCANMKAESQDHLVDLLYRCPNRLLYSILNDFGTDLDAFVNDIHKEMQGKGKNVNSDSIKFFIEQISLFLIDGIYNLVAATSTATESIQAIDAFDYKNNTNYSLLNLKSRANRNLKEFSKHAIALKKQAKKPIEKSIIDLTVRDFFLRNNVRIVGDGASLANNFFSKDSIKKLQIEMSKNKNN